MARVYNFSAGPAVLPEEVLKEAADEMLDYKGCGMSVMEMSHRSKMFQQIIDEAEHTLFPYTTLFPRSEERRVGKECMNSSQIGRAHV